VFDTRRAYQQFDLGHLSGFERNSLAWNRRRRGNPLYGRPVYGLHLEGRTVRRGYLELFGGSGRKSLDRKRRRRIEQASGRGLRFIFRERRTVKRHSAAYIRGS